jgi:FkbM family methyltransferase
MPKRGELAGKLIERPDTNDHAIVGEVQRYYKWLDLKGATVMDVGMHIGAFAYMASTRGARMVVGYEPDHGNMAMAIRNTCHLPNVVCYQAALTTGPGDTVPFVRTTKRDHSNYSTVEFRGRERSMVTNMNFAEELEKHRPSVLKMDAEGAEYDLLAVPLPPYVKQVAVELHFTKGKWRDHDAPAVLALFEGWDVVVPPRIGPKSWHTMAGWRRA